MTQLYPLFTPKRTVKWCHISAHNTQVWSIFHRWGHLYSQVAMNWPSPIVALQIGGSHIDSQQSGWIVYLHVYSVSATSPLPQPSLVTIQQQDMSKNWKQVSHIFLFWRSCFDALNTDWGCDASYVSRYSMRWMTLLTHEMLTKSLAASTGACVLIARMTIP